MRVVILILAILLTACGGGSRPTSPPPNPQPTSEPTVEPTPEVTPIPQPTAAPTFEPSPRPTTQPSPVASPSAQLIPIAWATPWPTPNINPADYIPAPRAGSTVRLRGEEGEDYAAKIQSVMDSSQNVAQVVLGPGSLKRSIIAKTHVLIETTRASPLVCDQMEGIVGDIKSGQTPWNQLIPYSDYGCILVADGVHVSGNFQPPQELRDYFTKGKAHLGWRDPYFQKLAALTDDRIHGNYSTIVEPSFNLGPARPGVYVIQALEDVKNSHRNKTANIAVTGIVFQGRQSVYDGGVRQTVAFGNCQKCSAQRNFLKDTASIGIQTGGVALDGGNFADNNVFTENIFSGVAAANIAAVNSENIYGFHNYTRRPGRKEFGGGVTAFDLETNSPADHSANLFVYNNLADFEGARDIGAGSAFAAQDPYSGAGHGKVVMANNVAIGGRDDIVHRYMSNGIYLNGLKHCEVINNYVYRTGQNALQAYRVEGCLIQDNDFEHTGGGGAYTVQFYDNSKGNTVRRSHFRSAPNVPINVQPGIHEADGSCGNTFENNLIDGKSAPATSQPCP